VRFCGPGFVLVNILPVPQNPIYLTFLTTPALGHSEHIGVHPIAPAARLCDYIPALPEPKGSLFTQNAF